MGEAPRCATARPRPSPAAAAAAGSYAVTLAMCALASRGLLQAAGMQVLGRWGRRQCIAACAQRPQPHLAPPRPCRRCCSSDAHMPRTVWGHAASGRAGKGALRSCIAASPACHQWRRTCGLDAQEIVEIGKRAHAPAPISGGDYAGAYIASPTQGGCAADGIGPQHGAAVVA